MAEPVIGMTRCPDCKRPMGLADLEWHMKQAFCNGRSWTDDAPKETIARVLREKEDALTATEAKVRDLEAQLARCKQVKP